MVRGSKVGIVPLQAITSSSPSRPGPPLRRPPLVRPRGALPGEEGRSAAPKCQDPLPPPAARQSPRPLKGREMRAVACKAGHRASDARTPPPTPPPPERAQDNTGTSGASGQRRLGRLSWVGARTPGFIFGRMT